MPEHTDGGAHIEPFGQGTEHLADALGGVLS
jgi:hypothetical protein